MRVAVLADIHANLHALEAVLGEGAVQDSDRVVVLGDLVGYAARPGAVIDRVRDHADTVVFGNHDLAVLSTKPMSARASARSVAKWTREVLSQEDLSYLSALPACATDASGLLCAHGCYLNDDHYYGYVTSTMAPANLCAVRDREGPERVALCGHTHQTMLATLVGDRVDEARCGSTPMRWERRCDAVLINPGSVGQPRDGDPRAAYAVVDTEARSVSFLRVAYDVGATAREIREAGLPEENARRLEEGR